MGNKRLLLEDAEGNLLVSEDATTGRFSELPGVLEEGRERLATLPGWAREKIEALQTTAASTGNFVRSSAELRSTAALWRHNATLWRHNVSFGAHNFHWPEGRAQ